MITTDKIKLIQNHYRDKGMLIVGLNDSQGVNTTSGPFKKGLLEYMASLLTSKDLTPEVINAFSLMMNKTEHIDYFLQSDLTVEEIKLSQIYSAVSAFEKVMTDIHLPKFLGGVANLYRLVYTPKPGDDKKRIATSIKEAEEPIIIYSSGPNNLMREIGNNPFSIKKDYLDRYKRPNYKYTLSKAKDPKTLTKVIDGVKRNFENILALNNNADIFALEAYYPKSLDAEEFKAFNALITMYNLLLYELCEEYGITSVETRYVGEDYSAGENNFHVSATGHKALAFQLIDHIYLSKISPKQKTFSAAVFETSGRGAEDMVGLLALDCHRETKKADNSVGYELERSLDVALEHKREVEVFQKVLTHKK